MTATLLTALLLAAEPQAEVETEGPSPWTTPTHARVGVGYWTNTIGLGMTLHGGAQLNDRIAVYGLVNGAFGLQSMTATAGALIELSLIEQFSIAAGVGGSVSAWGNTNRSLADSLALGVPLRAALTLGREVPLGELRNRFFIAAEGFVGAGVVGSNLGQFNGVIGVALGWQLM